MAAVPDTRALVERVLEVQKFATEFHETLVLLRDAALADEGVTLDSTQVKTLTRGIRAVAARRKAEQGG